MGVFPRKQTKKLDFHFFIFPQKHKEHEEEYQFETPCVHFGFVEKPFLLFASFYFQTDIRF